MFWWGMDWLRRWPILEWHVTYPRTDITSKQTWYVMSSSLLWQQPIQCIREFKLTTTTRARWTSPKKCSNEQRDGCARALKIFLHFSPLLCMNESEMTKLTTKNSFQGVKRRLKYVFKKKEKLGARGMCSLRWSSLNDCAHRFVS